MSQQSFSSADVDLNDPVQLDLLERYVLGVGVTPRMITNIDTGENYRTGEAAARALGVTRQSINNCINGRQKTAGGYRLVRASVMRRAVVGAFADCCNDHGTDYMDIIQAFRSL